MVATMSDQKPTAAVTPEAETEKITGPNGKVYTAKNLSAKADAKLVKRVEDYRWPNQMTVAELVLAAVTEYLDTHSDPKA